LDQLNEFTGLVRRCVNDYRMIESGDRIAVGVSGGKDSLVLLCTLAHLRGYYPKIFELEAVSLDLGFEGMSYAPVAKMCAELGIPYTCVKTDIREIVFDIRKEPNPCSLCAKMRRGILNSTVRARGMNKLALGHHADDAVETFLMSLLFEGRIGCFKPVTYMSRADICQIRPLIYADERRIVRLCEKLALPVVKNACPADKNSKRHEIKELLTDLESAYPDIRSKIFGAMKRLPLDAWYTPE
jgi:tRNA(Ile)-lysidine synthase TilS/MesJ